MQAHQNRPVGLDLPLHQRHECLGFQVVAVDHEAELPGRTRGEPGLRAAADLALVLAITDEIGDRQDFEVVCAREALEVRHARHSARRRA
jgi:hypothetical protein